MSDQTNLVSIIDKTQERFMAIAPSYMKYDSEKGFAIQILTNNPFLHSVAQKNPTSLCQAITNVAAIGLSLNPAKKEAYLIPRTVKIGNNYEQRIFLEPSYIGLCKLATDSGSIEWIQARPVYMSDEFSDNGPGEKPTHKYNAFAKDRGEFIGVYCVAKTSKGDYLTEIMTAGDVYSIRDRSEQYKKSKSGPWVSDFIEQARKTVVRRATKMWPKTNLHRLSEAVELSNQNEGFEPIVTSPSLGQYTVDQKEYFDSLITGANALGMYVFQQTITDETIFINLFHSFEKGKKGKYQSIVNDLLSRGLSMCLDIRNHLTNAEQSRDDLCIKEIIGDLSADERKVIESGLNYSVVNYIAEVMEHA